MVVVRSHNIKLASLLYVLIIDSGFNENIIILQSNEVMFYTRQELILWQYIDLI